MAKLKPRRTVRRRLNKNYEKGVVLGAVACALKSGNGSPSKLRASLRMLADDDELWETLATMQTIGDRLAAQGLNRWEF